MNDSHRDIKNLETEVKLLNLKLAQRRETSEGETKGAMGEDQMDAIFRAIASSQE